MSGNTISAGEGKSVQILGMGVVFKLSGSDTGGAFSIVEHPLAPRTLVAPHTHTHEDEFSFVLGGEVGMRLGAVELVARPGTYVLKPRGVPHAFWNSGPTPARIIEIISPAGFEKYFEELAELLQVSGRPNPVQLANLSEQYGLTYSMEWVPELAAKYHLDAPR